jgi:predicted ATPase
LAERAVGYWHKAGQQSMARSATMEAVVQLQRGLDLLSGLPESPQRQRQELDLRVVLGRALLATRGYAAPAVDETYARARTLAEQLDRSDYLVPLLYGQSGFHLMRAEHKLAASLYAQIEKIGQRTNDLAVLLLGHYLHGVLHHNLGEFVAARALFEKCSGMNQPEHRAVYAGLIAEDPHAGMLAHLAVTLSSLGYMDQARARIRDALSEAHQLGNPYTLTYVSTFASRVESVASSPEIAHLYAEAVVALSNEHGFPLFAALGTMLQGWSSTALGQPQEGLTLLTKGLSAYRATGAVMATPRALMWLVETYSKLGQPVECMNCLAEAEQIIGMTDERYNEAELHRLRGDLVLSTSDLTAAEQNYQRALVIANQQSAKTFELRAATSLAHLWHNQGKHTDARDLLAPVYNWFTEGFDTPVLKEAKVLLDKLQ